MRGNGCRVLAAIGVAVWLVGCGSPTPSPTVSSTAGTLTPTPASPTPAPPSAVDIRLTGADTAHLVSAVAVPCSDSVGNGGQPLLGVALDTVPDATGADTALSLTIVDFKAKGTYRATAVWAADGATTVTLDPNPNTPIASERFIAKSGTVTVTSAHGIDFAGSINATLIPESPTTAPAQVDVAGTWSCQE